MLPLVIYLFSISFLSDLGNGIFNSTPTGFTQTFKIYKYTYVAGWILETPQTQPF